MLQLDEGVPQGGELVEGNKRTLLFTLTTRLFGLFYRSRLEIKVAGQGAVFFGSGLWKVPFIKALKNFPTHLHNLQQQGLCS